MPARLRFAPSPTGQLHVGNARTALFNWLLARRLGGTFVLRIEDTDTERSTRESERAILDDLMWLGLQWDEGPNIGGPYAPYRQSDRAETYAAAARRLLDTRRAYRCFCSQDELEANRQSALAAGLAPKYSGKCRAIDPVVAAGRVRAGEPAALRFAVPEHREVLVTDLVRGEVRFNTDVIGDPLIVRSDGRPAYNFAVVVDDTQMHISHVVRGEDHLSNTPRQVLLYEALGASPPLFAHLSLVLGPDHAPLSKRHGATSVAEFRARGYLPEALVNYLALLGWSPGVNEEVVPLAEMASRFDLSAVSHSAAVFDTAKLAWLNRHYLKEAQPDRLAREGLAYLVERGYAQAETPAALAFVGSLLPLVVDSVDRLEELPDRVAFLFEWTAERAAELVRLEANGDKVVAAFAEEIAASGSLSRETFRAAATRARDRTGLKGRALFHPIRVALTARDSGPELDLAVPAIDHGATLEDDSGIQRIVSCAQRARAVAALTGGGV